MHNSQSPRLAILPFDNFTGNVDQDYFSRGFVEDLIVDLSRFSNLDIISPNTSLSIAADNKTDPEIIKKLNIDYSLKGNLRKLGGKLRISTQLINPLENTILWAEKYDAPFDKLFEIHDNIVAEVVRALSDQLNLSLKAKPNQKQTTQIESYDYWLHGLEYLRQGTIVYDEKARDLFKKALENDPQYSRAYAGLSLSYFNEWSCQLWGNWDRNVQLAFEYAIKAVEHDENDYAVHMVLGRIYQYRRMHDKADFHIKRSLELNSTDADNLAHLCGTVAMSGDADYGMMLFEKAQKLNPYHSSWYYIFGIMPLLLQKRFKDIIDYTKDVPVTIAVDFSAYLAAAYAWLGETEKAHYNIKLFRKIFEEKITFGHKAETGEELRWIRLVNPYKNEQDWQIFKTGLLKAGLEESMSETDNGGLEKKQSNELINTFKQENESWHINFEGIESRIPAVKGFRDISFLLMRSGEEIHCNDLMGSPIGFDNGESVMDEKAKKEYQKRITDLQEELQEAEEMNDAVRVEKISSELDQLIEHLSKSLGLAGKSRKLGTLSEKARTAVTWRIRNAIKKIEAVHPQLGKHFSNNIRTGTFCSYSPEKEQYWLL